MNSIVALPLAGIPTSSALAGDPKAEASHATLAAADASKASLELRNAVTALAESQEALDAAKKTFAADDAKVSEWGASNPEPIDRRARKRWVRKWNEYRDATVFPSWEAQLEAERHFRAAQMSVARFRPRDVNDLTLMAAAAAIYDKTHLTSGQKALISYGAALGLIGLQCAADQAAA